MKTLLLIIAIAGIVFFAYRKISDYYFTKGLKIAQTKYLKLLSETNEPIIGTGALCNSISGSQNIFVGTKEGGTHQVDTILWCETCKTQHRIIFKTIVPNIVYKAKCGTEFKVTAKEIIQ